MDVSVVESGALDLEAYARLQKAAFADVLRQANVSDAYMTPEYFSWKYRPSAGLAKIALVRDQGDLVAANAMYPMELRLGSATIAGWQSCDTATAPSARGKGHFQRCLHALMDSLSPDTMFFGFPNANSKRGFEKIGWKLIENVTTWVNPWVFPRSSADPSIRPIERFGAEQDALSLQLGARDRVSVRRSAAYMNWRYVDHPAFEYDCLASDDRAGTNGFAVVREAHPKGRRMGIVMELWGADASTERRLLRAAAHWAGGRGLAQLVLMDTGLRLSSAASAFFVPVPAITLPKRQLLMGIAKPGESSARIVSSRWRVQMGDWDAF